MWVLGIVQRGSGELRLELCPDNRRDALTLTQLVTKYVHPGTTVISDCWRGYNSLDAAGFIHLTVNHSKNFVDPVSGSHTQTIESSWRALKKRISRGGVNLKKDLDGLHFGEYLWFKKYGKTAFENLVKHIADFY